jgi:hypothetical protein
LDLKKEAKTSFRFMEENYEVWYNYRTKGLSEVTMQEHEWSEKIWVPLEVVLEALKQKDAENEQLRIDLANVLECAEYLMSNKG